MTPQELKNSILQLAIQGKLVEQRPEEGAAAELLEKILAAKDAKKNLTRSRGVRGGCNEGELFNLPKAAKSHPEKFSALSASPREEIPDDEKPFEIPESWEWGRLESIVNSVPSKQYQILESEVRTSGKFAVISQSKEYSIGFTDISEKVYHHVNPVIVFGDHTTEVKYVEFDFVVGADGVKIFEPLDGLLLAKYLFYVLLFNTYDLSKVGGYSRHYKFLKNKPIPLPPLAEQKRIVAKIEELLPLIDRYEKAWSRLEDFNKRFPVDMQKSLLQMAIQGKLVEQRAEEGTAAELVEKILAAKNAKSAKKDLTRSRGARGENKTSAPSASPREEIPDDEKPFDIPESWEWVRLGELAQSIQYGYNASAKKNGRIKFVRISDIHDGDVLWDSVPYCDINENDIETYRLRTNDILFARTGGTVGKSYLVRTLPVDAVYAGYLIRARYGSGLSSEYIKYFMESPLYWKQLKIGTIATAQPNCNGKTLAKMLLPLPPLAEQKRIVAKIEELLPLCDRLK